MVRGEEEELTEGAWYKGERHWDRQMRQSLKCIMTREFFAEHFG